MSLLVYLILVLVLTDLLLYNRLKNSKLVIFYRVLWEELVLIIGPIGLVGPGGLEGPYYSR